MRAEITTSSASADSRYTSLNLLGWALLCPHAVELLEHGTSPRGTSYPTAREAREEHEKLKGEAAGALEEAGTDEAYTIRYRIPEYTHMICIRRTSESPQLCARSKADYLYILDTGRGPVALYLEAATRIHAAKPWQTLLRALALYYELRIPVIVLLVGPDRIMYKPLEDADQEEVLRRLNRSPEGFTPSPNLCSLCDLAQYCPYRAI